MMLDLPWTERERRWRDALLAAVVPAGDRHPGLEGVDLRAFWTELDASAPAALKLGFRVAVWGFTVAPLAMGERGPLHRLPPDRRDAVLDRLSRRTDPATRQLLLAVKLVAAFGYLSDDGVRRSWDR